jgi:hypothetical protein
MRKLIQTIESDAVEVSDVNLMGNKIYATVYIGDVSRLYNVDNMFAFCQVFGVWSIPSKGVVGGGIRAFKTAIEAVQDMVNFQESRRLDGHVDRVCEFDTGQEFTRWAFDQIEMVDELEDTIVILDDSGVTSVS